MLLLVEYADGMPILIEKSFFTSISNFQQESERIVQRVKCVHPVQLTLYEAKTTKEQDAIDRITDWISKNAKMGICSHLVHPPSPVCVICGQNLAELAKQQAKIIGEQHGQNT